MSVQLPPVRWIDPREFKDAKSEALNARLNASETLLRARIGDQQVDDLIARFRSAAKDYPPLFQELYAKRDPYRWLAQYWAPRHERMRRATEVVHKVLAQRSQH